MIEVEIKIKITDLSELINKLTEHGFKRSTVVKETDIYFNGNDHDFRQSDEALRIRKVESIEGAVVADNLRDTGIIMTYKGPKLDTISMSRKEINTVIENFDEMKEILVSLGFRPVLPVVKERSYYFSEEMTACVDKVEGLGDFLELEIMANDESERETSLGKIIKELECLGYDQEDIINTSYLSMLEKKCD